jgi:hypothetical protein
LQYPYRQMYHDALTRVIQFACKGTAIYSTVAAVRELFIA